MNILATDFREMQPDAIKTCRVDGSSGKH
jgi:hypothetical protein